MIFVEPEHGAGHQETANFTAAVIENESLPIGMKALPRIGMLEKMRAIEVGEAMAVGREVGRDPIENDRDALLVQVIHKIHEILGRAVTRCGSEVPGRLISP